MVTIFFFLMIVPKSPFKRKPNVCITDVDIINAQKLVFAKISDAAKYSIIRRVLERTIQL